MRLPALYGYATNRDAPRPFPSPSYPPEMALELAVELFFIAQDDQELFCHRPQRLSVERVEKVIALLRERIANPPTAEIIAQAKALTLSRCSRHAPRIRPEG